MRHLIAIIDYRSIWNRAVGSAVLNILQFDNLGHYTRLNENFRVNRASWMQISCYREIICVSAQARLENRVEDAVVFLELIQLDKPTFVCLKRGAFSV